MHLIAGATLLIRWLGQACFLITAGHSVPILIDPPNPQVGYHVAAHSIAAQVVFVSHEHPDHNYVAAASGSPIIVQPMTAPGPVSDAQTGAITYRRIFAYHDNVQGTKRGSDTITVIQTGGLRIVHLGDLGELKLTPEQVTEIGHVDVLMIPVGGFFTIDGTQAAAIVSQLHPRVIIPMHFQTAAVNADLKTKLAPDKAFLIAMHGKAQVKTIQTRDLKLSVQTLPNKPTIYLLRYE